MYMVRDTAFNRHRHLYVEEHAILLVSDYRVTVAHWIGGLRYK